MTPKAKVLVVMGSDSDYPVVKDCLEVLNDFNIEFTAEVCSAHRTPERAAKLSSQAVENGYELIIAAAGKAAHLPGVLAAFTPLPVIGLPIKSSFQDGMDSLLSIVQMPPGVPVATVAINGGVNAGVLAAQILSTKYDYLKKNIIAYKKNMINKVENKNKVLKNIISKEFE